ncbi:MAG: hypothetical protein KJ057_07325 [Phycisphaerae bacterium]|nr:MAG: hypothetical protein EDS66_04325 [Planctomycetota bacterium]MBE7457041.1 hypothetical protein [Planctomycetia bacterium]MCK6463601.1 hypothetical protein [Phycisphaerae bacterium]MCL4718269.1 hypothetical protein [Phycisphaerae bacterium]MCQ3920425.1 hypothetical protein [Planctomycetota bacterium]
MMKRSGAGISGVGLVLAIAGALGAGSAWGREVPRHLRGIVMGDRHRPVAPVVLNNVSFESISSFSSLPYLLWPAAEDATGLPVKNGEAVRAWLATCAAPLGFEGFEPRYIETYTWRENDVLSFELVRRGIVLHDARILVHFRAGAFLGIQNHVDGRIVGIEDPNPADPPNDLRRYYAARAGDGEVRIIPVTETRVKREDRTIATLNGASGVLETRVYLDPASGEEPQGAQITEYVVPQGTFPDQISVDENGIVWFSQPNNNSLTSFNPVTTVFTQHNTSPGSGPDGMIVGTQGRVWSGMYFSGGLGWYDSISGTMHNVASPYTPSAMAIPVETSDGSVWVTDHANNKISEFNPVTRQWIRTVNMPTPNCWVVQGHEDTDRGQIYFTEYNANKLGRIALGGNTVTDINTLGGGPAFCVYSNNKVYYSRWNEPGMGVYDVISGTVTEYQFPVNNESGGPMWLRPNGDIVFGTRNRGYIMIFDVETATFTSHQIPTPNPALKDGLTVGADNVIWFTESGVNKIAKLVDGPACTGNESIKKAGCRAKSGDRRSLVVKLVSGAPGDTFTVSLNTGETSSGVIDATGKGKGKFSRTAGDAGTATARWGCGATDSEGYTCP